MSRGPVERLEFDPSDLTVPVGRMADLARGRHGWINVRPVIHPDDEPPPPGLFAVFGPGPHKVPTATWMAPAPGRGGVLRPAQIGLQHARGSRVLPSLGELGLTPLAGWRVVQDHPRRGLVASLPDGIPGDVVLAWLVAVSGPLCAVPTTGRWQAEVYRPA